MASKTSKTLNACWPASNLRNMPVPMKCQLEKPNLPQHKPRSPLAFLIVDLTFHGQPHLLQVRRSPPCSDGFVCLGSHPSLANRTGATIPVVVARCKNCSSQLCWLFWPMTHLIPDLYGRGGCARITTSGQLPATMV